MGDNVNQITKKIISFLRSIEKEKNIRILYACESGSRAWGFPSADSDYDVRFVYVQPVKRYLSLQKPRDVIEITADGKLDVSGWDLQKALLLLRKSNPPLLGNGWVPQPFTSKNTRLQTKCGNWQDDIIPPLRPLITIFIWPGATTGNI